jgi:Zn-dependent protease
VTEPTHEPTTTPAAEPPVDWSRISAEREKAEQEAEHGVRGYEPVQPGGGLRDILRKVWAPIAALVGLAFKFGFVFVKFGALFLSVGGYALLWGWRFGVGFVALILVHELGHFVEARRQGYQASLPMFVPFLGAFVAIRGAFSPWKNGLVALAGPVAGGAAAAVAFGIGAYTGSDLLQALGFAGFFLNLFNLIPVGFLDGGAIFRSTSWLWRGGGRSKGAVLGGAYIALALLLAIGMYVAHVPQHRL